MWSGCTVGDPTDKKKVVLAVAGAGIIGLILLRSARGAAPPRATPGKGKYTVLGKSYVPSTQKPTPAQQERHVQAVAKRAEVVSKKKKAAKGLLQGVVDMVTPSAKAKSQVYIKRDAANKRISLYFPEGVSYSEAMTSARRKYPTMRIETVRRSKSGTIWIVTMKGKL